MTVTRNVKKELELLKIFKQINNLYLFINSFIQLKLTQNDCNKICEERAGTTGILTN